MVEQEVTPNPAEMPVADISAPEELTPDDIFNQDNQVGDFFRAQLTDEPEQKPEPQSQQVATGEEQPDNDTVRYQYWQSEADKARNENEQLKAQLQQAPQQQVASVQEAQNDDIEGFPPPPEKPRQPAGFNREEAWSDSSSNSARHLNDVDAWRDNMDEYNRLHNDYNAAVMNEERAKMREERENILRQQSEREQYEKNINGVRETLTQKYQASPEEINDFVKVMESPDSVNLDNLFQLYRLKNGGQPTQGQPVESVASQTPESDNFDQMKRAQQVPSPMGVLPSSNKNAVGRPEDNVMDSMLTDYNNRNPWT